MLVTCVKITYETEPQIRSVLLLSCAFVEAKKFLLSVGKLLMLTCMPRQTTH